MRQHSSSSKPGKNKVKSEGTFRRGTVAPFLKTLKKTAVFPIQQIAIVGDPDYILCCNGTFIGLELKKDGEIPRPSQQFKLDCIEKSGGKAIVACPSNWESVKLLLRHLNGRIQ